MVVLAIVSGALGAAPTGAQDDEAVHRPPVEAPVVDPFRAPAGPYGAGNRGLTYDLAPDTAVRASGRGTVVFAGQVGGTLHVTVLHEDGIRTSYSFLASIAVARGQAVTAGARVGTAGAGFHFGARTPDAYIDPALLFGERVVDVALVPDGRAWAAAAIPAADGGAGFERRLAGTLVAGVRAARDVAVGSSRWAVDAAAQGARAQARVLGAAPGVAASILRSELGRLHVRLRLAASLSPQRILTEVLDEVLRDDPGPCTPADAAPPPAPGAGHVALLVAGFGSSSEDGAIDDVDVDALGYGPGSVLRYSYAGGRVPDPGLDPDLADLEATAYSAADTHQDLRAAGHDLAELITAVAAARPGVPIDLLAHSQGGVVVRLALAELAARGELGALGTAVTIGTPHDGSVLAGAGRGVPLGLRAAISALELPIGADPMATSMEQLGTTSGLLGELRAAGVPAGVRLRTIGARADLIVPGDRTDIDGIPHAAVALDGVAAPLVHDRLPGAPETTREVALALASLPPGCRGALDRVLDAALPELISSAEAGLGLLFG